MRMKALVVFVLAFCAAVLPVWGPVWGQDQNQDRNSPPDEPAAQQQPADAAPLPQAQEAPQAIPAEPGGIAPPTLTSAPGALIAVRINQWLSSDRNHPGDTFSGADHDQVLYGEP